METTSYTPRRDHIHEVTLTMSTLWSNMEEYVYICDLSNWHSELDISHALNYLNLTQISLDLGTKCPGEKCPGYKTRCITGFICQFIFFQMGNKSMFLKSISLLCPKYGSQEYLEYWFLPILTVGTATTY